MLLCYITTYKSAYYIIYEYDIIVARCRPRAVFPNIKYIRFVIVGPIYIYIYLLYNSTDINNLLYRIIPPTTSVRPYIFYDIGVGNQPIYNCRGWLRVLIFKIC